MKSSQKYSIVLVLHITFTVNTCIIYCVAELLELVKGVEGRAGGRWVCEEAVT